MQIVENWWLADTHTGYSISLNSIQMGCFEIKVVATAVPDSCLQALDEARFLATTWTREKQNHPYRRNHVLYKPRSALLLLLNYRLGHPAIVYFHSPMFFFLDESIQKNSLLHLENRSTDPGLYCTHQKSGTKLSYSFKTVYLLQLNRSITSIKSKYLLWISFHRETGFGTRPQSQISCRREV